MGGWRWDKKDTVEGSKQFYLTAEQWKQFLASPDWAQWSWRWHRGEQETGNISYYKALDGRAIRFVYTSTDRITGERTDCNYLVNVTTTPCHYGGVRYWLICPLVKNGIPCGRRVGKLYLVDTYFGCRHCYNLTYRSCQEHDSRLDLLKKNPEAFLALLKGGRASSKLLALKALLKYDGL